MKSKCLGRMHLIKGRIVLFLLGLLLVILFQKNAHSNTKSTRFKGVKNGAFVSQNAEPFSSWNIRHGVTYGVGVKEQPPADNDKDICRINGNYSHVLLPQKTSLFYCQVPKTATTFTSGFLDSALQTCLNNDSCFVNKDQTSQDTFSFMWTREPYGRLYSAYENKLFSPNKFWKLLGKLIIKAVRKTPSQKSLTLGHDVSFAELVKYVTSVPRSLLNPHLRPINETCNPCIQRFDFIGRLETFPSDFGHICSQLQTMNLIRDSAAIRTCQMPLPEARLRQRMTKLFELMKSNENMLSSDDRHSIMERAWRSFQIRGYVSKNMSFPFSAAETNHIKFEELYTALNKSIEASKTNTELKLQKRQAMIQAYMSVPIEDMVKLKEFVKTDCQIFGYDEKPAYLFRNRDIFKSDYDYFDGLL